VIHSRSETGRTSPVERRGAGAVSVTGIGRAIAMEIAASGLCGCRCRYGRENVPVSAILCDCPPVGPGLGCSSARPGRRWPFIYNGSGMIETGSFDHPFASHDHFFNRSARATRRTSSSVPAAPIVVRKSRHRRSVHRGGGLFPRHARVSGARSRAETSRRSCWTTTIEPFVERDGRHWRPPGVSCPSTETRAEVHGA
jgi:hypothetical protein